MTAGVLDVYLKWTDALHALLCMLCNFMSAVKITADIKLVLTDFLRGTYQVVPSRVQQSCVTWTVFFKRQTNASNVEQRLSDGWVHHALHSVLISLRISRQTWNTPKFSDVSAEQRPPPVVNEGLKKQPLCSICERNLYSCCHNSLFNYSFLRVSLFKMYQVTMSY